MAGSLTANTIKSDSSSPVLFKNSSGTQIGTLAYSWLQFNSGGLNNSFNVSSLTKNGTGDYTVNFSNALPTAFYSSVCNTTCDASSALYAQFIGTYSSNGSSITKTTTQFRLQIKNQNGQFADPSDASVAIFC